MNEHCNYINSEWMSSADSEAVQIKNPADTTQIIFETVYADSSLCGKVMDSAAKSFGEWSKTKVEYRAGKIAGLLKAIESSADELAKCITLENGKLFREAQAEIRSALNEANYQLEVIPKNLVESIGKHSVKHEPLGAVLLITPWNFPVATILRKMIPALLAGNTVIVKASEVTPRSSVELFKLIEKTEFPAGTVNLLMGWGAELVPPLLKSGKIRAVSFTGSDLNGKRIAENLDMTKTRYQAEMGGNNTVLVLADADLEAAANAIITNGFACCGQWCTGTGKVIVESAIKDTLTDFLLESASNIILGNGLDPDTTMGPIINESQLNRIKGAVALAKIEGGKILTGGRQPENAELKKGCFFEPTIISGIEEEMKISDEEIFGPVVLIQETPDYKEAIRLINNSKYGLSFSVYTQNIKLAEEIVSNVNSGLTHINLPTAFRDPALPLLGWKNSGLGLPESGRYALDFFTQTKAVYRG